MCVTGCSFLWRGWKTQLPQHGLDILDGVCTERSKHYRVWKHHRDPETLSCDGIWQCIPLELMGKLIMIGEGFPNAEPYVWKHRKIYSYVVRQRLNSERELRLYSEKWDSTEITDSLDINCTDRLPITAFPWSFVSKYYFYWRHIMLPFPKINHHVSVLTIPLQIWIRMGSVGGMISTLHAHCLMLCYV